MSEFAAAQLPPQCEGCPTANLLKDSHNEAALQESVLMRAEAEALEAGEQQVAQIASSALAKVSQTRKITEAGINGLEHCPGFEDKCGLDE